MNIGMLTETREEGWCKAWGKLCLEFKEAERSGDVNEFLCRIADMICIYGDPNTPVPTSEIRMEE